MEAEEDRKMIHTFYFPFQALVGNSTGRSIGEKMVHPDSLLHVAERINFARIEADRNATKRI